MGIMSRIVRIWKADVNGVMDELEDKGLLLKQSIREMEEELDRKHHHLKALQAAGERLQRELENSGCEQRELEKDLEIALAKGRDDIGRMLIRKIKLARASQAALAQHLETTTRDTAKFQELFQAQKRRYEQYQLRAKQYFADKQREQWSAASSTPGWDSSCAQEPSAEEIELELLKYKESFARDQGE